MRVLTMPRTLSSSMPSISCIEVDSTTSDAAKKKAEAN